jgi:hypothetical protein
MPNSQLDPRPWYCSDALCDSYKVIESTQGSLRMLQALKVFRAIVLNVLLAGFGTFVLIRGGDATVIGLVTILALSLLNGIEVSEWVAAKRALDELQGGDGGYGDNNGGDNDGG